MNKILIIGFLIFQSCFVEAQTKDVSLPVAGQKTAESKGKLPHTLMNVDISYDFLGSHIPFKMVLGSGNNGIILGFQRGETQQDFSDEIALPSYRPSDGSSVSQVPSWGTFYSSDYLYSYVSDFGSVYNADYNIPKKGAIIKLGYQKSIFRGLYANLTFDICHSKRTYYKVHTYNTYYENGGWLYSTYTYEDEETSLKKWGIRANLGLGYTISFTKSKRMYANLECVYSILNRSNMDMARLQFNCGIGIRLGKPASTKIEGLKDVNTIPISTK